MGARGGQRDGGQDRCAGGADRSRWIDAVAGGRRASCARSSRLGRRRQRCVERVDLLDAQPELAIARGAQQRGWSRRRRRLAMPPPPPPRGASAAGPRRRPRPPRRRARLMRRRRPRLYGTPRRARGTPRRTRARVCQCVHRDRAHEASGTRSTSRRRRMQTRIWRLAVPLTTRAQPHIPWWTRLEYRQSWSPCSCRGPARARERG